MIEKNSWIEKHKNNSIYNTDLNGMWIWGKETQMELAWDDFVNYCLARGFKHKKENGTEYILGKGDE